MVDRSRPKSKDETKLPIVHVDIDGDHGKRLPGYDEWFRNHWTGEGCRLASKIRANTYRYVPLRTAPYEDMPLQCPLHSRRLASKIQALQRGRLARAQTKVLVVNAMKRMSA